MTATAGSEGGAVTPGDPGTTGKLRALQRVPGTVGVVMYGGRRWRIAECGCCERERRIFSRGLCQACYSSRLDDGTVASYGYVQADRVAEFSQLRSAGYSIVAAGQRLGVTPRTAQRYETALRDAGEAPWREHAETRGERHAAA
jgi:hypothetical protein